MAKIKAVKKRHPGLIEHVGARVHIIRRNRGMSVENLAYLIGIESKDLEKFEKGSEALNDFSMSLMKVRDALGTSLGILFSFEPLSKLFNEQAKILNSVVVQTAKEKDMEPTAEEIEFFGKVNALRPTQIKGYKDFLEGGVAVLDAN